MANNPSVTRKLACFGLFSVLMYGYIALAIGMFGGMLQESLARSGLLVLGVIILKSYRLIDGQFVVAGLAGSLSGVCAWLAMSYFAYTVQGYDPQTTPVPILNGLIALAIVLLGACLASGGARLAVSSWRPEKA